VDDEGRSTQRAHNFSLQRGFSRPASSNEGSFGTIFVVLMKSMTRCRPSHHTMRVNCGRFGLLLALITSPLTLAAESSSHGGRWHNASVDDYRKHLGTLTALTQACAKSRDLQTCDPTLVGLDDLVSWGGATEPRLVRYGWLRILFSHAEEPDQTQSAPDSHKPIPSAHDIARVAPPTTSQLLADAQTRLAHDLAESDHPPSLTPAYSAERDTMRKVLAERDFRNLQQPTETDIALERIGNWINKTLENVAKLRARSAWVGRALVAGFLLVVGVGLAWGFLQIERRWRLRLVPESNRPAADAPSARDWQLWLQDAHNAAAAGQWRDAIHFVYWAAIARLESTRLWPADRARTPREYLALMAAEDPRQPGLASLTGSFERTWYGGRVAHESDYRHAASLADALISGRRPSNLAANAEGAAQ
jgi:hypothetical protein